MFGFVPLHLTTVRKCHLKNTGINHAYFQVMVSGYLLHWCLISTMAIVRTPVMYGDLDPTH